LAARPGLDYNGQEPLTGVVHVVSGGHYDHRRTYREGKSAKVTCDDVGGRVAVVRRGGLKRDDGAGSAGAVSDNGDGLIENISVDLGHGRQRVLEDRGTDDGVVQGGARVCKCAAILQIFGVASQERVRDLDVARERALVINPASFEFGIEGEGWGQG
jgi:hypothetical protein